MIDDKDLLDDTIEDEVPRPLVGGMGSPEPYESPEEKENPDKPPSESPEALEGNAKPARRKRGPRQDK